MQAVIFGGFVEKSLAQQFYCSVYDPDGPGASAPTGQINLTHIGPDGREHVAMYHPQELVVRGPEDATIQGVGVMGDTGPITVTVSGKTVSFNAPKLFPGIVTLAAVSLEALVP